MKLKELRESNGRDCVYIGNTQELIDDIDRFASDLCKAQNEALNKANKELGQQRAVIRDLTERNRTLELRHEQDKGCFEKQQQRATLNCGAYEKVEALRTETAEKLDKLHIETSERLQKLNGDFAYRISTDIRSVEQKVEALRVELNKRIDGLNKRIDGLEDFKHTHEGRLERLEEHLANPPLDSTVELRERIDKLELNTDSRDLQLLGELRSQNRQLALQLERIEQLEKRCGEYDKLIQDNIAARVAIHNRVQELEQWRNDHSSLPIHEPPQERVAELERRMAALNEWTCRLGDILKSAVERTRP